MSQLSICINRRLDSLSSTSFGPFIFKINEQLRKESEKAYEPEILSVGPYHYGKVNLQMMEEYKLRYLKELLKRRNESVDKYVEAMENLEEEARKCYAEPIKLNKDKFVEMMLLDGCFIIELFRKFYNLNLIDAHDPIFRIPKILKSIQRDLLLFENQIPLSVLVQLFVMTKYSNQPNPQNILVHLALDFFSTTISNLTPSQTSNNQPTEIPKDNKNHLLGLVHDAWYSSIAEKGPSPGTYTNHGFIKGVTEVLKSATGFSKCKKSSSSHEIDLENVSSHGIDTILKLKDFTGLKQRSFLIDDEFESVTEPTKCSSSNEIECEIVPSSETSTNHEFIKDVRKLRGSEITFEKSPRCFSLIHDAWYSCIPEKEPSLETDTNHEFIKSVTELQEAGIKFKKTKCSSLLDVKFENGIMKIPSLPVDDDTEWLFRNLIAYEQYSGGIEKTYMTDYTTFMDCLLKSPKDVEILRHSGIIDNSLGDDKVVSTMFNKMRHNFEVNVGFETFHYGEVFKEVNEYCKHRRHRCKAYLRYNCIAYLRYNYCNSPWTILSVIVAGVFLLLTVIQTVCSILQL